MDDSLKDFLSPAFYLTPPADVNSPNSIYLNPADEMTGIDLYSTLAHEGFPGHLYQTVSFSRSDPLLIRHLYAPSGYVEGWATYVESYACRYAARNLDANTQALCRLWYLNRSVHLTLCSLLDLGIHSQGWLLGCVSLSGAVRHHGCVGRCLFISVYSRDTGELSEILCRIALVFASSRKCGNRKVTHSH